LGQENHFQFSIKETVSTQPTGSAKKSSSNNLNCQIAQYSLAAAVAGVSMLALAGEVVVTKKTIPIPLTPTGVQEPVKVSMANNGMNDFSFELFSSNANSVAERILTLDGATPRDRVIAMGDLNSYAAQLQRGRKIGGTYDNLGSRLLVEASVSGGTSRYFQGFWGGNLKDVFLGVRFLIDSKPHYGWIRLTVTTNKQPHGPVIAAKITAYAYETLPNKPILAGAGAGTAVVTAQPTAEVQVPQDSRSQGKTSLGMLALGADVLSLWRREETLTSG
jgi:hypothetical protein